MISNRSLQCQQFQTSNYKYKIILIVYNHVIIYKLLFSIHFQIYIQRINKMLVYLTNIFGDNQNFNFNQSLTFQGFLNNLQAFILYCFVLVTSNIFPSTLTVYFLCILRKPGFKKQFLPFFACLNGHSYSDFKPIELRCNV